MYTGSFTWIVLSSLIVCGVSEFTCPKVADLSSSVQLLCTYSNPPIVLYSSSGIPGSIASCDAENCLNLTEGYYPTFISVNKSKLEIRKVQLKDGGNWTCQAGSTKLPCTLVLTQTPTCHITSGNDTKSLDICENISLSVNITNYYCSTPIDFLLRAGNTKEVLTEQTTVKEQSITSDVFNRTFNVTESHIGSMELIFICNNVSKAVQCGGVRTLLKRPPMCNITADGDTGGWEVGDEITMYVYIEDYYCSGDHDFFLLTGGEKERLNETGIYNETITFTVKESHFGPVYMEMNCNDDSRNLTCNGIQELSKRHSSMDDSQMAAIIGGTIGALVSIIALVVIILYIMRKQNVKLPKLKPACVKA